MVNMIISEKNLVVIAWDHKKHELKQIQDKNIGYKLEVGQRLQAIRYDKTNKELYFDVIIKDIDAMGLVIEKEWCEGKETHFLTWTRNFKNWKGEEELNHLEIEPIDNLYQPINLFNCKENQIYFNNSSEPCYSRYHNNFKYFCRIGQLEIN